MGSSDTAAPAAAVPPAGSGADAERRADETAGRRDTLATAGGATSSKSGAIEEARTDLRFEALRNALYHSARRGWYELLHRGLMFVVVIAGSGVVASLGGSDGGETLTLVAALFTAVAGALDLVFDFNGKACEHTYLTRRSYEILATLADDDSEAAFRRAQAEMIRLYADERPQLRALNAVAHNTAADSLYGDEKSRLVVDWWQSLWRHVYPFNGTTFRERPARKAPVAL